MMGVGRGVCSLFPQSCFFSFTVIYARELAGEGGVATSLLWRLGGDGRGEPSSDEVSLIDSVLEPLLELPLLEPSYHAGFEGLGFRDLGLRTKGSEFRVQGLGVRGRGLGFSGKRSRLRVQESGILSRIQGSV